jgi:dTDP-4-amino-4,6-dideoxygalactose transaminase
MRSLVNHGRSNTYISIDDDDTDDPDQLKEIVSQRFNFERIGHSFRITELEAALAVAQLETWKENIAQRQANFEDRLQLPTVRPHTTHSYMMWPIVLREGDKWSLIHHLEERGIETREMLRLTDQPCYRGLWNPDDYPVAKWLNEQGFYCGCHPGLTTADLDRIIAAHEEYFRGH